ncbi:MAG: PLP-dependent transferase [Opitutaceae bacterium]
MSSLRARPLGQPIPESPHAVSCSLPTMAAVRGYEEKDPAVTSRMAAGYPRFFVNPLVRALEAHLAIRPGMSGRKLWLTSSARMARELVEHLARRGLAAEPFEDDGVHGVAHPSDPTIAALAKVYLQNVGGFLSSREAEDILVWRGLRIGAHPETDFPGGAASAAAEIQRRLLPLLPGAQPEDLALAPSGMNAVHVAFRAIADLQKTRGRTGWVQLGWLYMDTIEILRKCAPPGEYRYFSNVFDLSALEHLFAESGSRIAGLVTEIPTNPLVETPDVAALAGLCRRHGVALILDPTLASVFSVDVLRHADVLVTSLTKYTASDGDVIAGLAVVNRGRADADELRRRITEGMEPVYPRDLARLAAQIGETSTVLARIQASAPAVARFLASHPKVREVHWALQPNSADAYRQIARHPAATGGVISFAIHGPLQPFYDRLLLAKGPSFGMKTTLICPFMYLAHYDLVASDAGRAELAASRLDPDLLRLCVGIEPVDEILAALDEALR